MQVVVTVHGNCCKKGGEGGHATAHGGGRGCGRAHISNDHGQCNKGGHGGHSGCSSSDTSSSDKCGSNKGESCKLAVV